MGDREIVNVVSLSGGKDSTALALLAIEKGAENVRFVFADTGHEHHQTYEYVEYLSEQLVARCGVSITRVSANFADRINAKRDRLADKWRVDGVPESRIEAAIAALRPTGIPFLDLCLLKGRFPSTRARFCSQELKHVPIQQQVMDPLASQFDAVISWQGVRADESRARAHLQERDVEFGSWDPVPAGMLIYRPIIAWSVEDVFAMHRKHGVHWNPLYEQGMGRVGCMPCIHARKDEIREIARRFPDEVERVAKWERMVGEAAKRGASSFFSQDKTPGDHVGNNDMAAPDIHEVVEWSKTTRGGRNYDLIAVADHSDDGEAPACSSIYGLCE